MRLWIDRNAASKTGTLREVEWDALAEELSVHRPLEDKGGAPVWSPALFRGPTHDARSIASMGEVVVLDMDHLGEADLEDLDRRIEASGVECVVYSTYSHAPDRVYDNGAPNPDHCLRVVVRLTEGYPPERHHDVRAWVDSLLGGHADPRAADPARVYYVPSCPPDRMHLAFAARSPGRPLDPNDAPRRPKRESKPLPASLRAVDELHVRRTATRWARSPKPDVAALGSALGNVLSGTPYADPGERDDVTWRLAGALATTYPDADPQRLAALFSRSLSLMGADAPTVAAVAEKLSRAQRAQAEEALERSEGERREQALRILEARGGASSEPYTPEELDTLAAMHGYTRDELRHRWVVQQDRTYYLLGPRGYAVYSRDSVCTAALTALAPAVTAGVEVWSREPTGRRLLSSTELVSSYGTVVESVQVSLTAARTRVVGRTMIEAPCPLAEVEPREHPEVDRWLRAMTPHPETLIAWLSHVARLEVPCAALVLVGRAGAGKSLLAGGLARLWGRASPTALESVVTWNDALTRCPLLLADERLPRDTRGHADTAWLRDLIQARERPLTRKYQGTATIRGAVRLLVAANDLSVLANQEDLSAEDIQAVAERYVILPVLDTTRELEGQDLDAWRSLLIAEHVAHLGLRPAAPQGRFLVRGPDSLATHRDLATRSGLGAWVVQLLGSWLAGTPAVARTVEEGAVERDPDGSVRVTALFLERAWPTYLEGVRRPPARAIARALATLGKPTRLRGGSRARAVALDLSTIREWCDATGRSAGRVDTEAQNPVGERA